VRAKGGSAESRSGRARRTAYIGVAAHEVRALSGEFLYHLSASETEALRSQTVIFRRGVTAARVVAQRFAVTAMSFGSMRIDLGLRGIDRMSTGTTSASMRMKSAWMAVDARVMRLSPRLMRMTLGLTAITSEAMGNLSDRGSGKAFGVMASTIERPERRGREPGLQR
jgi:hypothetical protein